MATIHVVGAGLAGLAAAIRLAGQRQPVVLYEAAQQAGGRCRSYFDRGLGRIIDNGNHLLLSGNRATLGYLEAIGAGDQLTGPPEPCFPFLDLASGERWVVRPNRGLVPIWPALPGRRVPGTRLRDYLGAWRLACAGPEQTVADCLDPASPLWRRFWDPLARAVLNTPPEQGSARLLWAAVRESFARGGAGCRPLIARTSLAASLIDPALGRLAAAGVRVAFGHRLRAIRRRDGRAEASTSASARSSSAPRTRSSWRCRPARRARCCRRSRCPRAATRSSTATSAWPGRPDCRAARRCSG